MILILTALISFTKAQNACIWGRVGSQDVINGEYIYQGEYNGSPSFKKQYRPDSSNIYYLWKFVGSSYNRYIVSSTPIGASPTRHAECSITTNYPWECGPNQWEIYDWIVTGNFVVDPNVYSQQDSCPQWDCDSITTNINYQGCDGIFDVKLGPNAWSNTAGDRFFYFNTPDFRWLCHDKLYYTSGTPSSVFAQANSEWTDITGPDTVNIHFPTPYDQTQQIQCIKAASTNPTNVPSTIPTKEPSTNPTTVPSTNPTKEPSTNPTKSTVAPSQTPTHISSNPTKSTVYPTLNPMDTLQISSPTMSQDGKAGDVTTGTPIEDTEVFTNKQSKGDDITAMVIGICVIIYICIIVGGIVANIIKKRKQNKIQIEKELGNIHPDQQQDIPKTESVSICTSSLNNDEIVPGSSYTKTETDGGVTKGGDKIDNNDDGGKLMLKAWIEDTVNLGDYYDNFINNGYESLDFVKDIREKEELVEIGIILNGHQTRILKAIEQLQSD